jgi:hypothetical protein
VSNLKAEMHAGKPMKQSLAIAYATKRRNGKKKSTDVKGMAHGGSASPNKGTDQKGKQVPLSSPGAEMTQAAAQKMNMGGMYDPEGSQRGGNAAMKRAKMSANKEAMYANGGDVRPNAGRDDQGRRQQMATANQNMLDERSQNEGRQITQPGPNTSTAGMARGGIMADGCPACMAQGGACSMHMAKMAEGGETADDGDVGGAKTSTTGNKTKTGGSNPGGASTGGAGTVTITTGKMPPSGINISDVGGRTDSKNAGGMDPSDENDDMMKATGGRVDSEEANNEAMLSMGGPATNPSDPRHAEEYRNSRAASDEALLSMGGEATHPTDPRQKKEYMLSDRAAMAARYAMGGDVDPDAANIQRMNTRKQLSDDTADSLRPLGKNAIGPVHGSDTMELPSEGSDTDSAEGTLQAFERKPLKMARGGSVVDEIMRTRGHASADEDQSDPEDFSHTQHTEGGENDGDQMNWEKEGNDFSNYHSTPDSAHGDIPADLDDTLVGQLLKDRRNKRRGM